MNCKLYFKNIKNSTLVDDSRFSLSVTKNPVFENNDSAETELAGTENMSKAIGYNSGNVNFKNCRVSSLQSAFLVALIET